MYSLTSVPIVERIYKKHLIPFCLTLCLTLFGYTEKNNAKENLEELHGQDSIIYKTVNGESLALILFLPKEKKIEKTPWVLFTHGGGWIGGNRYVVGNVNFYKTLQTLLDRGIACASVEYRLARKGNSTAYDCVVDCKDASRFLIQNADKYGLDSAKWGVWGGSAGGHLSLMTGLAPDDLFKGDLGLAGISLKPSCILSYYPLTSFMHPEILVGSTFENPKKLIPLFGGELKDKPDLAKLLSPDEYLTKESPPVMLIHGDQDKVLLIKNSEHLKQVADERGVNLKLVTVKGGGHGFQGNNISPSMDEINKIGADFLIQNLAPLSH